MTQLDLDRTNSARLLQDICRTMKSCENCVFYRPCGIADWKDCIIACPNTWDLEKLEKEMNKS